MFIEGEAGAGSRGGTGVKEETVVHKEGREQGRLGCRACSHISNQGSHRYNFWRLRRWMRLHLDEK